MTTNATAITDNNARRFEAHILLKDIVRSCSGVKRKRRSSGLGS